MKAKLLADQPLLEKSREEAKTVAVSLADDKEKAALMEQSCSIEKAAADAARMEAQSIRDDCQRDIDEVMPLLHQAIKALEALDKRDLQELKSFPAPPALVETVMNAVCVLLGRKESWEEAKKVLNDTSLLVTLREYDKDHISPKILYQLSKYTTLEDFLPERVANVSKAATSLCMWVRAIESYAQVLKVMEPKQKRLMEAEGALQKAEENLAEKQRSLDDVQARVQSLTDQYDACQERVKDLENQMQITEQRLSRAGKVLSGVSVEGARWAVDVKAIQDDMSNLLSDVLLAAGTALYADQLQPALMTSIRSLYHAVAASMLVYAGPFTREYREELNRLWLSACLEEGLHVREDFSLARTLSTPSEIRQWSLEGLPSDLASVENAILVCNSPKPPLIIDPEDQGTRWFRKRHFKREFMELSSSDANVLQSLSEAVTAGMIVLVTLSEPTLDPALGALTNTVRIKPEGRTVVHLGDYTALWSPHFRMVFATKLYPSELAPELHNQLSVINFRVTPASLEEQLLNQIILHEAPHLEEQRGVLVVNIAKDLELKAAIQEKILSLLANAEGDILADDTFLDILNDSRLTYEAIERRMEEASATSDRLEETRKLYKSLSHRGSLLYLALRNMSHLHPFYLWSLEAFKARLQFTLQSCEDTGETRGESLKDSLTWEVYCNTCRGLLEQHRLVLAFMIAKSLDSEAGNIPQNMLEFFLRGPTEGNAEPVNVSQPPWTSSQIWNNTVFLDASVGGSFRGFAAAVADEEGEWRATIENTEELPPKLPQIDGKDLGDFASLVAVKAIRGSALYSGCRIYVQNILGTQYTCPPQLELSKALDESTPLTPLIFILSPGSDPIGSIKVLAARISLPEDHLHFLSLGQGQIKAAEKVLQEASDLENRGGEDVAECPNYKRWLFSLALFHSIISERRKFGALGWNKAYEWTVFDFRVSQQSLFEAASVDEDRMSWDRILFLTADIHYGGRVTDQMDQRLLTSLLKRCFAASELESQVADPVLKGYVLPPDYCYEDIMEFAMCLPVDTAPDILGLDSGAAVVYVSSEVENNVNLKVFTHFFNIWYKEMQSNQLLDSLVCAHREMQTHAGGNRDESLISMITDVLSKVPEDISVENASGGVLELHENSQTGLCELTPLSNFLKGELCNYNALLAFIRRSLTQLLEALRGWCVMTEDLDNLSKDLYFQKVPTAWIAASYPSKLSLSAWLYDLRTRTNSTRQWAQNGPPKVFDIATFYNPQSFFKAALRVVARALKEPPSSLALSADFTDLENKDSPQAPEEVEIFITGISLQGAVWSTEDRLLRDANPREMFQQMPPIHLVPKLPNAEQDKRYRCPVYRTADRAACADVVTFLDLPTDDDPDKWVQRSVALLCETGQCHVARNYEQP
ncbi:Dynein heavy chain, related [Eimeria brunetti]|uniref:Dynein heavy chain, related n=1 Tax=Eimeria brunetti TaxID=51314 RepID=U6LTY0_9EIME|nr:Dynein heavy chain, related [Eimeria brunetti]